MPTVQTLTIRPDKSGLLPLWHRRITGERDWLGSGHAQFLENRVWSLTRKYVIVLHNAFQLIRFVMEFDVHFIRYSEKACGPIPCDDTNLDWGCWECCDGWKGKDCQAGRNTKRTTVVLKYICIDVLLILYAVSQYYALIALISSTLRADIYFSDVDECGENNGGCSYKCVNSLGTYRCGCPEGYTLDGTGHNCKGLQH